MKLYQERNKEMGRFLYGLLVFICIYCSYVRCQIRKEAVWCTTSTEEKQKCDDLLMAIARRQMLDDSDNPPGYPPGFRKYSELPELKCTEPKDRFTCMSMISSKEADLIQLDPGMGYTAGEYFTMMPIMAEKYDTSSSLNTGLSFYAVAVVKRTNSAINFNNLRGKKACHPGVGHAAGWTYPVAELIEHGNMTITECNVPVKSAAAFFGDMCAPNGLARFYNPFGNNPVTVCENCKGKHDEFCTGNDPYADYTGAFSCMATGDGDVAFVRESTIYQAVANGTKDYQESDFELLCTNGRRAAPSEAATCNWGSISSHIIMTSAIHDITLRNDYKELLKLLALDFGVGGAHVDLFEIFKSSSYGKLDLMFSDETKTLIDIAKVDGGSRDTYYTWVGPEYTRRLAILNTCPLRQCRWCVISRHEMTKCEDMIMAFAAKGLKPDLNCILGTSVRDCMGKIQTGDADMVTLDASDVYVAGKYYGLVPIAAEDYSGYDAQRYYAVAVARRVESHLTIFNLKARRGCHSGVMTAAGWVVPVDKLIETGQIHVDNCNVYFTMGQFFSKSCVPGVLNKYYNRYGTNPINLCEACASGGQDHCQRNDEELYYGNSGAFRCLTEKGGDVAFLKHTTVRENTDGRNQADWARNRRSDDYELLCNDGTRADIDQWKNCNMGEVPSNGIVTAKFKSQEERNIYWTLLNFAQKFFASDTNTDFSMFDSLLDHKDLIFQDSTVRLIPVAKENQNYQDFLGARFVRAMERMEGIDCITTASAETRTFTLTCIFAGLFTALFWQFLMSI